MINFEKLDGYRKAIRPVDPNSLPRFVDDELVRVGRHMIDLIAHIKNLEERITALETP